MIKFEHTEVYGWEAAIRGMRNPKNSWEKSDTWFCHEEIEGNRYGHYIWTKDNDEIDYDDLPKEMTDYGSPFGFSGDHLFIVGRNDRALMTSLAKAGPVHAKYRRMINVTVDITAPLYWWKEFDTYKVGTVADSCSTMHKIQAKEFTLEDFSCEHLFKEPDECPNYANFTHNKEEINWHYENGAYDAYENYNDSYDWVDANYALDVLETTIYALNSYREKFLETGDKRYWWQMIQLLPTSYNQKRTVQMNYEVLAGIYPNRKDHKLDEWHDFCDWIKELPYSEIITLEEE